MFEHIVLRRPETGDEMTAGRIAEALLYYQRVHLILERGTLMALVRQIGTDGVLRLLRRPEVSAVYTEEFLGTKTDAVHGFEIHQYSAMTITGHESIGTFKTVSERICYTLKTCNIEQGKARRFAKAFLDRVPVRKLSTDYFFKGGVPEAAKRDLLDPEFSRVAVRQITSTLPGGFDPGPDFRFDVIDTPLGVHVFHSIDLEAINRRRALLHPPQDPITIAFIINLLQDARADLVFASFYGGDFITSTAASSVVKIRHEELLRRTALNVESQTNFQEIVLPDTPSIAEVVDSGERTFDEFLLLLDKAGRFKHWLKTVNPDEGLVRSYLRDVSSEGWIQRLPAKTARYILTLGLDATSPTAGLVSGFIDNFIIEKLLGGWKPNHFVTGRLGPFSGTQ